MKLHTLKPAKGSIKSKKRIGRGQGSGRGGTSTRGHNGAKSRSGYSSKIGFEGGQMPLQRRVPKFGFKNINRISYKVINISTLQDLFNNKNITDFNLAFFRENGLAGKNDLVKILATGDIKSKINVQAHAFSKSAIKQIEEASGTCEVVK